MTVAIPPVGVGFILALIVFVVALVLMLLGGDLKVLGLIAALALARMLP